MDGPGQTKEEGCHSEQSEESTAIAHLRPFTELALSMRSRCFAALSMTGEGFRVTPSVLLFQPDHLQETVRSYFCVRLAVRAASAMLQITRISMSTSTASKSQRFSGCTPEVIALSSLVSIAFIPACFWTTTFPGSFLRTASSACDCKHPPAS